MSQEIQINPFIIKLVVVQHSTSSAKIVNRKSLSEPKANSEEKLHQGLSTYIFYSRPLFFAIHQIQTTLSCIGISSSSPQIVATNKGLITPYHIGWYRGHSRKKGSGNLNLIRKILLHCPLSLPTAHQRYHTLDRLTPPPPKKNHHYQPISEWAEGELRGKIANKFSIIEETNIAQL